MRRTNKLRTALNCQRLERRDAPAIVPIGPEFRVNTVTSVDVGAPSVALDAAGGFVIAWQSVDIDGNDNAVVARRYDNAGTAITDQFQVNTYTTGSQQTPSVAADAAGNSIIVWGSASVEDGSREGVYGRRYNSAGAPLGGPFQVNQFTLNIQGNPSVAMDGAGDFVVAWESNYQDGDGYAIYARKYSATGAPLTDEILVNTATVGDQRFAEVAIDSDGDFVVVWQGIDADGYGVFARRFNSAGSPLGGEFQVNMNTTDNQMAPKVAISAGGAFAVVWQSRIQDNGNAGVYIRRYDAAGAVLGNEVRVNSFTSSDQWAPAIGSNANGELIVTWQSEGQDGNGSGIYAQRIGANGAAIGSEFRVHTTTPGLQYEPAVASDAYGDFVVAWTAAASPFNGILAQRYAKPPAPRAVVSIDDGSGQRSSIRYVTLAFNTLVNIAPGGITLTGPAGPVTLTLDDSQSSTWLTNIKLTFSGNGVTPGGLIDGRYTFTLSSPLVTNLDGEGYDGNGDGIPGPNGVVLFHRLFGDVNGDANDNFIDHFQLRLAFGTSSSQPGFRYYFDYDGDGNVNAVDLLQFRIRFGTTI